MKQSLRRYHFKLSSLAVNQTQAIAAFWFVLMLPFISQGTEPMDVAFVSRADMTEQRYVELMPPDFQSEKLHDVVLVFHGHGSDRWQFIRDHRDECRGVRDIAAQYGLILIAPD